MALVLGVGSFDLAFKIRSMIGKKNVIDLPDPVPVVTI